MVAAVAMAATAMFAGCGETDGDGGGSDAGGEQSEIEPFNESCTTTVAPKDNPEASTKALERAFINSEEGSVICMTDGTYELKRELNITKSNVTIRGESQADTILDFSPQEEGANGILVQAEKNFAAINFTIQDTPSDLLKVKQVDGVVMKNITATWTRGPSKKNGAYALYPVQSKNVLMEGCVVKNSRDAGVYLGQSENAVLRDNEAYGNVVGLEIENTFGAEAYNNRTENNANGILVVNLPDLMVKGGGKNLVHDNTVVGNNERNFAQDGTAVSSVPSGSGILVMSSNNNEVWNNTVKNNKSGGLALVSYAIIDPGGSGDPEFDPFPEGNWIHDNTFTNNGSNPKGNAQIARREDGTAPQIFWDGRFDDSKDNSDGSLTNCFGGNEDGSGNAVEPAILSGTSQCPDPPSDSKTCQIQCEGSSPNEISLPDRVWKMAGSEASAQQ